MAVLRDFYYPHSREVPQKQAKEREVLDELKMLLIPLLLLFYNLI